MDIIIKFNYSEKTRLLQFADTVLHAGHWGSSDIVIPEQQNLFKMLQKFNDEIELSFFYSKMLVDWIEEATHEGTALLPEDISIINKLLDSLRACHTSKKNQYLSDLKQIEKTIDAVNALLPHARDEAPPIQNMKPSEPDKDNNKIDKEIPENIAGHVQSRDEKKYFASTIADKTGTMAGLIFKFFKSLTSLGSKYKASIESSQRNEDISGHIEKAEKMAKYFKKRGKKL